MFKDAAGNSLFRSAVGGAPYLSALGVTIDGFNYESHFATSPGMSSMGGYEDGKSVFKTWGSGDPDSARSVFREWTVVGGEQLDRGVFTDDAGESWFRGMSGVLETGLLSAPGQSWLSVLDADVVTAGADIVGRLDVIIDDVDTVEWKLETANNWLEAISLGMDGQTGKLDTTATTLQSIAGYLSRDERRMLTGSAGGVNYWFGQQLNAIKGNLDGFGSWRDQLTGTLGFDGWLPMIYEALGGGDSGAGYTPSEPAEAPDAEDLEYLEQEVLEYAFNNSEWAGSVRDEAIALSPGWDVEKKRIEGDIEVPTSQAVAPVWEVTLPVTALLEPFGATGEDLTFSVDWSWYEANLRSSVHAVCLLGASIVAAFGVFEEFKVR